ncbi:SRPBCC family protein [Modestobacter versicolor]|uniref:SRPBCC family protein n=1 Tax=Modestobacter versicolor TaxID=429133 RepID=UPI0034DFEE6A
MSTIEVQATVEVDRPSDDVWRLVADYGRDPEWRRGVATMAPSTVGPVVAGTTTAERLRMAGRTFENTGVVTAVEPGRWFTWCTTSGAPAHGGRTVTPLTGGRSRVDLELVVTLAGLQRAARPVLAAVLRRGLAADAARLTRLLENAPR